MLRSRSALLFSLLIPIAGCSGYGFGDSGDGGAADPLAQLEADTGTTWTVRYHPDVHTPAFLEGRTAPMAATPSDAERAGRAFLLHYHAIWQMAPDEDLASEGAEADDLGMTHARFVEKKEKVPVWGADLVVHFDAQGELVGVNGRYLPLSVPTLDPTLGADEARVAATLEARALRPEADPSLFVTKAPSLVIYPISPTDGRLAWAVDTALDGASPPFATEILIDATDGSVLHRADEIETLEGSGVGVFGDTEPLTITSRRGYFWLEDPSRGGQKTYSAAGADRLPGTEVHSKQTNHWDETGDAHGAAVDAHAGVAEVYDYFLKVHKRAGWDGKAHGPRSVVHYSQGYDNAYCDGKQLVFGDGDGTTFSPFPAALDVIAHEYTHGITFKTAKLVYEGQSGALNEAISDIFGSIISQSYGKKTDWKVGEAIYHPNGRPAPLRDIADPHQTNDPASMSEYVDTTDDNGGVHLNSTIVAHAAYLMSEGGSFGRGIGPKATAQVWFRALTHYLTSQATFRDAADATISAAKDLGGGKDQVVRAAWVEVGVMAE